MKITKEKLNQIIKEEIEATVEEGIFDFFRKKKPAADSPKSSKATHADHQPKIDQLDAEIEEMFAKYDTNAHGGEFDVRGQCWEPGHGMLGRGPCANAMRAWSKAKDEWRKLTGYDGTAQDPGPEQDEAYENLNDAGKRLLRMLDGAWEEVKEKTKGYRDATRSEREEAEWQRKRELERMRNQPKEPRDVDHLLSRHESIDHKLTKESLTRLIRQVAKEKQ